MDEKVFSRVIQIGDAEWGRIGKRLTYYAAWKVRAGVSKTPSQGKGPEDIASEAIEKVLSGERHWDVEKYPDPFPVLKGVVDSLVSQLWKSEDRKRLQRFPETPEEMDRDLDHAVKLAASGVEHAAHLPDPPPTPLDLAIRKEEVEEVLAKFKQLEEEVKGDEVLEIILLCLMDGITKPAQIVEKTGLQIYDVYQGKRQLLRIRQRLESQSRGDQAKSKEERREQ